MRIKLVLRFLQMFIAAFFSFIVLFLEVRAFDGVGLNLFRYEFFNNYCNTFIDQRS